MRSNAALAALAAVATLAASTGCGPGDDCAVTLTCEPHNTTGGSGGTTSNVGGGGADPGTGGGGGAAAGGAGGSGGAAPVTVARMQGGGIAYHICALLSDGEIRCWGDNAQGQLGLGNTFHVGDDETASSVGSVPLAVPVEMVAAGRSHTCVLGTDRLVRCWGSNTSGQLGYGNTEAIGDTETAMAAGVVDLGGTVAMIDAGQTHTCALLDDASVRCWGSNSSGQLGLGHVDPVGNDETPAQVSAVDVGGVVTQIAVGRDHTCVLLENKTVKCWGFNAQGQLGYGHQTQIGDNELPSSVGTLNLGGTVERIEAGQHHTCALRTTGALVCWGSIFGSVGIGNGTGDDIGDNEVPAGNGDVDVGGTIVDFALGAVHSCALLDNQQIKCWGRALSGALGNGDFTAHVLDPSTAGFVNTGGSVESFAIAGETTCAKLQTGNVVCWGYNTWGEVGTGLGNDHIGDEPGEMPPPPTPILD